MRSVWEDRRHLGRRQALSDTRRGSAVDLAEAEGRRPYRHSPPLQSPMRPQAFELARGRFNPDPSTPARMILVGSSQPWP